MKIISLETGLTSSDSYSIEQLRDDLQFDVARETVLLIDDNRDLLRSIAPALNESFNLLLAEDGQEGIDIAKKHCPDLILTDLNMPNMDGLEVLRIVKEDISLGHIPVIIITAVPNESTQHHGLSLGAEDVIIKPVKPSEIAQRIKNRLQANRRLWALFSDKPESLQVDKETLSDNLTTQEGEKTNGDKWLNKLHQYIQDNLQDTQMHEVKAVASHMGCYNKLLTAKIFQLTGVRGARTYIREYRLDLGRKQLLDGWSDKISYLARTLGFSESNFSNKYKLKFGEWPSETQKRVTTNDHTFSD